VYDAVYHPRPTSKIGAQADEKRSAPAHDVGHAHRPYELERATTPMTIGTSLILIAAGAILRYAVTVQVVGVDLQTVGLILMLVGGAGLLIGLALIARDRSTTLPPPPDQP